jgi:hypothetical protein
MPFPKFGNNFFHPLTQFVHKAALQAAAVPIHGSTVALLDRVGQIWLLPLELSEQSGLRTGETPKKMPLKLAADLSGKAASLRFSPDGRTLVGADNRGNLGIFVFKGQGAWMRTGLAEETWMNPVELPAPRAASMAVPKAVFELDDTGVGVGIPI